MVGVAPGSSSAQVQTALRTHDVGSVIFLGGWAWAWSPRRKADFENAARMPLGEEGENNP